MKSCLRLNVNFLLSQFDDIDLNYLLFSMDSKDCRNNCYCHSVTSTVLDKSGHIILKRESQGEVAKAALIIIVANDDC